MNIIEQDGEHYWATGEVRKVKRDEFFIDHKNNLVQFDTWDESLAAWPIYHRIDKRTVAFVLDSQVDEKQGLREGLKILLVSTKDVWTARWAERMLAHLEGLEK